MAHLMEGIGHCGAYFGLIFTPKLIKKHAWVWVQKLAIYSETNFEAPECQLFRNRKTCHHLEVDE